MRSSADPSVRSRASLLQHQSLAWLASVPGKRYGLFMLVASVLGLLKTLALSVLLPSQAFGIYGLALVVYQVGFYVGTLGTVNSLVVTLPISVGRRDDDDLVVRRSVGFVLLSCTGASALFAVAVLALAGSEELGYTLALACIPTAVLATTQVLVVYLQAHGRLLAVGVINFTRAALVLLSTVGLAAVLAEPSSSLVVLGESAAVAATGVLAFAWVGRRLAPAMPRRATILPLIRSGFPLALAYLSLAGFFVIDRVIVAALAPTELGLYTFASLASIVTMAFWTILYQAVPPRLLRQFGEHESLALLHSQYMQSSRRLIPLILIGALAIAIAIALTPSLLPKYAGSGLVMALIFVGATASLFSFADVVLQAARRFYLNLHINLIGLAATATLGAVALGTTGSLVVFASVMALGRISTCIVLNLAARAVSRRPGQPFPPARQPAEER